MRKIQDYLWIAFGLGCVLFVIYKITKNIYTDNILEHNAQYTRAIIISEKNYMGNQPVDPKFSYSYRFSINGKEYTGDSHDTTLKIGDTVEIKFNKDNPALNRPAHPKE